LSLPPVANRNAFIAPFRVMELLWRARELEAQGRSVVHLEIGEPDFSTADAITRAGIEALEQGKTHYTPSLGLADLRDAIAASYGSHNPGRDAVVVTPGASGALALIFGALLNPGDEVMMADPGYPCHRHYVSLYEGVTASVPVGPDTDYQLTAELVAASWTERTRAVLVVSPSNPTGTMMSDEEMQRIMEVVRQKDGVLIVDEIYQGLVYDDTVGGSALRFADDVVVINSFSKYYGMTGWRIGWLVLPPAYRQAVDHLAQNMFVAPSTPGQYAAIRALDSDVVAELQRRRRVYAERRDYLLPALRDLGFRIPVTPQGAYFLYADCSDFTDDSRAFAYDILETVGVAITPGIDFGSHRQNEHVRISYANDIQQLKLAVSRLQDYLSSSR